MRCLFVRSANERRILTLTAVINNHAIGDRRIVSMTQKTFTFEFEDDSPKSISFECEGDEQLRTTVEGGVPFVFANRAGMLALAKLLIKLSLGTYRDGFHVHLRADFSGDGAEPDVLTVLLNESSTE